MACLRVAALALCGSADEPSPVGVEARAFEVYLGRFTDWSFVQLHAISFERVAGAAG